MKIVVLTTSYPRYKGDDSSIFIERITEPLAELAPELELIVPLDREEPLTERRKTFTIHRYKYGLIYRGALAFGAGILPNIKAAPARALQLPAFVGAMCLKALSVKPKPEVILAHWILSGVAAYLFRIVRKTPYVVVLRGSDMALIRIKVLAPFLGVILKKAARIIVVADHIASAIVEQYGIAETRVITVYNGVAGIVPEARVLQELRTRYQIKNGTRVMLCVGKLIARKNQLACIEAIAQLSEWHLILCGQLTDERYCETLNTRAAELGVTQRVHFAGHVDPEEIPHYLGIADVLVSAAHLEGRPNAVLEAMANGVPVVLSDIPAHREVTYHGSCGVLFSSGDRDQLVREVVALLHDTQRRNQLVERARLTVEGRSWASCAAEYYAVCRAVVEEGA